MDLKITYMSDVYVSIDSYEKNPAYHKNTFSFSSMWVWWNLITDIPGRKIGEGNVASD